MVKKIRCKVVRSVPLSHETCQQDRPKRASRQFALAKSAIGQNATYLSDKVRSLLDNSFGLYKFAEEAPNGQLLDVWA
jgi:hypothetical protein